MHLLCFIPTLSSGGAERVITNLSNYWAKKNWKITIVTLSKESSFYKLDPAISHIKLDIMNNSSKTILKFSNNFNRIIEIRKTIKTSNPDAVLSFITTTNIIVSIASIGLQLPIIVSERNNPYIYPKERVWRLLRYITYFAISNNIVVQTKSSEVFFKKWVKRKLHIIPNPVLIPLENRTALKEDLQEVVSYKKKKTIIAMGRLVPQKNFELLINAFELISHKNTDWNLDIWGEGPLRESLESTIQKKGLSDRVFLKGKTEQPLLQMSNADIFVLSSFYEGFPNVLCEAMSCGLPVVSTNCQGASDIIRNGYDGFIVPIDNCQELSNTIEKIITNDELRKRLSRNAREICYRFDINSISKMWEELFITAKYKKQQGISQSTYHIAKTVLLNFGRRIGTICSAIS